MFLHIVFSYSLCICPSLISHASTKDDNTLTAKQIADIYYDNEKKLQSLMVQHQIKMEAPNGALNMKRYLKISTLRNQDIRFAFKNGYRYFRMVQDEKSEDVEADATGKKKLRLNIPLLTYAYYKERLITHSGGGDIKWRASIEFNDNTGIDSSYFPDFFMQSIGMPVPNVLSNRDKRADQFSVAKLLEKGDLNRTGVFEEIEGVRCISFEANGIRIWLDPSLDYCLRRREIYHEGTFIPKEILTNRVFKKTDLNIYVPTISQLDVCAPLNSSKELDGKSLLMVSYALRDISFNNVDDSIFQIKFEPGTEVFDFTISDPKTPHRKGVHYQSSISKDELESVSRQIKTEADKRSNISHKSLMNILFIIGCLALCVTIVTIYKRIRTKSRMNLIEN